MNKEAMYKLSYGLFVLTAKEGKKEAHHYPLNKWRLIKIIIKRLLLWRN